jgi:hypothetical protein
MTKKLKAPIGAEGANIGTTLYVLDADGCVEVPDDDAQTLVGVGGFALVSDDAPEPEGHTVLRSLDGPQSCSFGTSSFTTDADGFVTVPTSMVDMLLSHGFVVAPVVPVVAPVAAPVADPAAAPVAAPAADAPKPATE